MTDSGVAPYNLSTSLVAKILDLKPQAPSRLFCSAAACAFIAFALVNIILHFGTTEKKRLSLAGLGDLDTAKAHGRIASWWLSNAYLSRKSAPDMVIFGSSQLGGLQAADAELLDAKQDYVLNHDCVSVEHQLKERNIAASCFAIGMVGSMISDHYLISRALFSPQHGVPKLMVVTVSPRDFIDGYLPSLTATEPFRFFSPYVSDSINADLVTDPVEKVTWYLTNRIPIRSIWQSGSTEPGGASGTDSDHTSGTESGGTQNSEKASKPMQRLAQDPLLTTNTDPMSILRPGQCVVAPHMPQFFVDNSSDYRKRYHNSHGAMYERQMQCFNKLASSARAQGISLLVVGLPLEASNWSLLPESFWNDYRGRLQTACNKNGGTFVEWSHDPGFDRNDFVDGVHLNAHGGEKLAEKIAETIASAPNIVAALKSEHAPTGLAAVGAVSQ